jgi:hypothetical protein
MPAAHAGLMHNAGNLGFNPNAPAFVPGGPSEKHDDGVLPRCSFCNSTCNANFIKVYYSQQGYAPLCSAPCWQSWVKDKFV